ncbi:MAG TPA: 50S ribosomal protein L17 [Chloroflexota bacterium]
MTGKKLGRPTSERLAMLRNLLTDLLRYERIRTTEARAKALRPFAERVITLGKRGDLHARRQALALVYDEKVVHKLFEEIAPRLRERPGGYTRIVKVMPRRGDAAPMAVIELVS